MATEAIVPAAPAAPPPSVPATPAAAAPAATGAAPAPAATETAKPAIDPSKLSTHDYAAALVEEKLANLVSGEVAETGDEQPAPAVPEAPATETAPTPDAEKPAAEAKAEGQTEDQPKEEDFQLEPEAPITPESLSQMVKDNPDFGKLLDTDPRLKGQLYKTAREAAELKPYREIFPDVESAKVAQESAGTWNDVRELFLGSSTKEGTLSMLGKMAELSYERDAEGNPVVDAEGNPVIGDDFYGFVDHVVGLDLENREAEVTARLKADRYATAEERERDESIKAALDILRENLSEEGPKEELPAALQRRAEEIERREREQQQRAQEASTQERKSFEHGLQQEAQKRVSDGIQRILANVEKQGAAISPYLKNVLPAAIGAKLVRKIQANPVLQGQMKELQRLPAGDQSRQRRLTAIDRAIQQYLPDVAREELRQAGVQVMASSEAKRAKEQAQAAATQKTEPKGATSPGNRSSLAMSAKDADVAAKAEWQKANPGKLFDRVAQEQILPRVLQLMGAR